jgi:hypothetical protein
MFSSVRLQLRSQHTRHQPSCTARFWARNTTRRHRGKSLDSVFALCFRWPSVRHLDGRRNWQKYQAERLVGASPVQQHGVVAPTQGAIGCAAKPVNTSKEAIQGEENGPKVAFNNDNRVYVVWSIPGEKGDKTRANIRFAAENGTGGFTPARTLNEVKDTARFPIIEFSPDGNVLVAWIDRRIDNPKPRQLYLMRISSDGKALTKNYPVGEGLCECCKLGISFADGGKTVYMVDRQVDDKQVRNHVLRKSTDGARRRLRLR